MAITHDSVTFDSLHGPLITGPWNQPIAVGRFPGITGVLHLIDRRKEREVTADFIVTGYATAALLESAIDAINAQAGLLVGTLSITGDFERTSLPKCTFLGFDRTGPVIPGLTGIQTWTQRGRLRWIQRAPV